MGSQSFTFVNTTDTPGLSPHAAKKMRAHITRTNFAKRRVRLAKSTALSETCDRVPGGGKEILDEEQQVREEDTFVRSLLSRASTSIGQPAVTLPDDPFRYAQILCKTWSVVFLEGQSFPNTPAEASWVALLASEPALVESSLAIGLRHWSPDASCQVKAKMHWSRAASLIVERITAGCANTDAVLGAVASMAFGECLAGDAVAWGIHVEGLARLLVQRREAGVCELPEWFYGMLILDSLNDVLHFPRFYHQTVLDAMSTYGPHPIFKVAALGQDLKAFRHTLNAHRPRPKTPDLMPAPLKLTFSALLSRIRALKIDANSDNPFLRATLLSYELVLHLSRYRHQRPAVDLTSVATDMKEMLSRLSMRPCSYMDLTSCHLIIGAVAAHEGSETRTWFVAKLRSAVRSLGARGWDDPLGILERGFVPEVDLKASFSNLWEEIGSM